jgi:hypothetical protein
LHAHGPFSVTFHSQPSSCDSLQSAKPLAQGPMPQLPAVHVDTAFCGTGHAVPQLPQFEVSV